MKYIRGQDGGIYSVAQLKPPCKEHIDRGPIWRLVVRIAGKGERIYATYSTEKDAILAYGTMTSFMTSQSVMIKFGLGVNSLPDVTALAVEAAERMLDQLDEEIERADDHLGECPTPLPEMLVPGVARPWLNIPASAVTPWWRKLWPWRRKGESE